MVSKLSSYSSQENKLKFWHNLFLELENSPVSIKKFCAKHEISSSTLYKWKKIFQEGDNKNVGLNDRKEKNPPSRPTFIAIPLENKTTPPAETIGIDVILPNGIKIVFNQKIELPSLVKMLQGII